MRKYDFFDYLCFIFIISVVYCMLFAIIYGRWPGW